MQTMSDPWIPSTFTDMDGLKEGILDMAAQYKHAFRVLPKGQRLEGNTWVEYDFDGVVSLWIDTSHDEAIEFYQKKFKEDKEKTMTTALTTNEQQTVRKLLGGNIQAIKSVLPKHLTPEKMLRMAYASVVLNPKLARCTQLSLMNSVIEASSLGLEIGGPLALAHLVPFGNEAKIMVDYKGWIELAYRSSLVSAFTAHPVYENDHFEYWYGINSDLRHTPFDGKRGDLVRAYAIVKFKTGGFDFEVVDRADAMAAKERSKAKDKSDSPWNKPLDEWTMWVKTAIRRLLKRIPKSPELQRAMALDNAAESGEDQRLDHVIDVDFESYEDAANKDSAKGNGGSEEPAENTEKPEPTVTCSAEEKAIVGNFEVTRGNFPEEFDMACKDLGYDPKAPFGLEMMQGVNKKVSEIVDSQMN